MERESKIKKEKSGGFSWRKFGAVTEINGARQCRPESRIEKIISCFWRLLNKTPKKREKHLKTVLSEKFRPFIWVSFCPEEKAERGRERSPKFDPAKCCLGAAMTWEDLLCLGCVSTSAWLMALAEKSCHLRNERGREGEREGHTHTHTHEHGERVRERERAKKNSYTNAGIPPQRNIHATSLSLSLSLSLSFPPSPSFLSSSFFTLSSFSFLLRKVIRGLMESPNRSFSRFSLGKT